MFILDVLVLEGADPNNFPEIKISISSYLTRPPTWPPDDDVEYRLGLPINSRSDPTYHGTTNIQLGILCRAHQTPSQTELVLSPTVCKHWNALPRVVGVFGFRCPVHYSPSFKKPLTALPSASPYSLRRSGSDCTTSGFWT